MDDMSLLEDICHDPEKSQEEKRKAYEELEKIVNWLESQTEH